LESGVAYSIFYLYPIMILLMSGHKIHSVMILAVLGVYLLASKDMNFFSKENLEMVNDCNNKKVSENTLWVFLSLVWLHLLKQSFAF